MNAKTDSRINRRRGSPQKRAPVLGPEAGTLKPERPGMMIRARLAVGRCAVEAAEVREAPGLEDEQALSPFSARSSVEIGSNALDGGPDVVFVASPVGPGDSVPALTTTPAG